MALIGYARTSTAEQTAGLEDQVAILQASGCERIFSEHESAATADRTELSACFAYLREGDTLVVTKPDRLARSVRDLLGMIDRLGNDKIDLHILDMGAKIGAFHSANPTNRLIVTVLAAIAEWEREIMLERQRAGIAKAKAEGKYRGRQPALNAEQVKWATQKLAEGWHRRDIYEHLGCSRAALWRHLRAAGVPPGEPGKAAAALTVEQQRWARRKRAEGMPVRAIKDSLNCSQDAVYRALQRKGARA